MIGSSGFGFLALFSLIKVLLGGNGRQTPYSSQSLEFGEHWSNWAR
jgi:hypothetical protein